MLTNNLILIIFLIVITTKAMGDGLRQRDVKEPNEKRGVFYHFLWILSYSWLALLIISIPKAEAPRYIIAFALIRFALFDIIRNLANREKSLFIGNTSAYDKILNKIFNRGFGKEILLLLRGVCLIIGMFLIQYYQNYF